jgi:GTP pyrophosphokinase
VRKQYTGLGRRVIERAFGRAGKPLSEERLQAALPRLARATLDDVFASVGRGEMRAEDVVRAVHPDWRGERKAAPKPPRGDGWFGLARAASLKFRIPGMRGGTPDNAPSDAIPIRGINSDLPVRFAPKGGAVPGDRIVGILTAGEGITIYPIQSPALKEFEDQPERWLDVRWDIDEAAPRRFPAQISVMASNAPGTLAQIAQVISDHAGNIDNIRMARRAPDFTELTIDIEVYDLKHLNGIVAQLRGKPVVSSAERVNG